MPFAGETLSVTRGDHLYRLPMTSERYVQSQESYLHSSCMYAINRGNIILLPECAQYAESITTFHRL